MNSLEQANEIYSEIILDLFKHPINKGFLKDFDLQASGGNPICGDKVQFQVKFSNNKVEGIKFTGQGCAISMASASMLTDLVKGKTIQEIKNLNEKDVFEVLGNIIETRIKCSLLGLVVLKKGLEEIEKKPATKVIISSIKI